MPHGITQRYLPPGRGDIPALTPEENGTRLSDPSGMQGLVGLLHTETKTVTHPGTNRARRALTSFMRRTPLTTRPRRLYNWHSAGSPGWPFLMLKYKYIFQTKYTEAIVSNSTCRLLWFETSKPKSRLQL